MHVQIVILTMQRLNFVKFNLIVIFFERVILLEGGEMNKFVLCLWSVFVSFIVLLSSHAAFADLPNGTKFGAEWINNWTGSSCTASLGQLYYRDDLIEQFASALLSANGTQAFLYSASNVQADHAIEDYNHNGYDLAFADTVQIYAFAGHGDSYYKTVNNSSQEKFRAYYYTSGNSNYVPYTNNPNTNYAACVAESEQMYFGEASSITNYGTNPGSLRWLFYNSCYSVDVHPAQQWISAQLYGVDMILGYRGPSYDGETVDEVLADFADDAFDGTSAFKQTWFDANEDWWIDEYPSLVTCDSINTSNTTSQYRLNNYNRTWTKRQHDGSAMNCSSAYTQS